MAAESTIQATVRGVPYKAQIDPGEWAYRAMTGAEQVRRPVPKCYARPTMKSHERAHRLLLTFFGAALLAVGSLLAPPLASPVRADHGCDFMIRPSATGEAGSTFEIWSSHFLKRLTFSHEGEFVRVVELGRIPDEYFFETSSRDAGRWDIHAESTGCEENLRLWVTLPGTSTGAIQGSSRGPASAADDIGRVGLTMLFLGTVLLMLRRPPSLRRRGAGA